MGGRNTGTFTLTFVDEYGDRWTTKPIPTKVRLSRDAVSSFATVQGTSGAATGTRAQLMDNTAILRVDFGERNLNGAGQSYEGLRVDEISIGDVVVNGNEIRVVQSLEYGDGNERTHYRYMTLRGHFGNGLTVVHTTGTDNTFYRITVEKEIREALRALPNGRIQDVTVEAITNGGYFTGVSTMSNGYTLGDNAKAVAATGKSGTVDVHNDDATAFDAAAGGVVKFSTNTHAFTMSSISSGVITFATDTAGTTLKTGALTGSRPAITGHATGASTNNGGSGYATTTTGTGSGLKVNVVTANGPTLTSVTVATAGTGYKPGDVITVTGAGSGSAGDFDTISMTLQESDFAGTTDISDAGSTYLANVGPNMLKTGKNRQFLKISNINCASSGVLTFTHDATTALSIGDKVTISGIQKHTTLAAGDLTGTKPAVTANAIGTTTSHSTTTSGSGTGLVVSVQTSSTTALQKVTVTEPGTGYKRGDVITVTSSTGGSSVTNGFDPFSMTLLAGDFGDGVEGKTAGFLYAEHTVTGATATTFTAAATGCSQASSTVPGTDIPYEVYGDVTAFNANAGSAVQTAVPVNGINYGDTIRVGDEFRRVEHDAGSYGAPIQSLPTASITIAGGVAGTKTGVQPTTTQASSGLTVDIVVKDDDELTSITVTAAGSGYEVGQELTFAAVTGTPAYNEFKYTLTAGDFGANTGKIFRLSSGFAVPETRDTVLGFDSISTLGNLAAAALTGTLNGITGGVKEGSGVARSASPSGGSGSGLTVNVLVTYFLLLQPLETARMHTMHLLTHLWKVTLSLE